MNNQNNFELLGTAAEIVVEVTARDGREKRLVSATAGDVEHRDVMDPNSATARRRFLSELANKLGVEIGELDHVDGRLTAAADAADDQVAAGVPRIVGERDDAHQDDRERLLEAMPEAVKIEAKQMLESKNLIQQIVTDIEVLGVAGERTLAATIYLVGTSRLLTKPLAAIVQGSSTSGKSYTIERVASMFPPEGVVVATQMTPQALFHMPPGSLEHRFIVAGERSRLENDDRAEATRSLREMISAGRLIKLMPVKVEGEIRTISITQGGPIAFIESTTQSKIFNEDANRCLMLTTDERKSQTERIVRSLAKSYTGAIPSDDKDQIVQRHHAAQRMLRSYIVVVPFADRLAELIPTDKIETRRAFPQLVSAVQAFALLHQYQRQIDADGRLVAVRDDYELARHLLVNPLGRLLGGKISDPALRFHDRLKEWATGTFTTRDVVKREKATDRAVRGWLIELHDVGRVDLVHDAKGPRPASWKLATDHPEQTDHQDLPTAEKLFS